MLRGFEPPLCRPSFVQKSPQPPFNKGGLMKVNNYHPPLVKGGQEGDFKRNGGQEGDFEISTKQRSDFSKEF